jgi:hypothetical protein
MWDYFEPKDNQWYRWDINGASAFLQKKEDSWQVIINQIRFKDLQERFGGPFLAEKPESKDSAFSFVIGKAKKAALRPYLSGLPYLVTVKDDTRLLPGAETRFDVMLPPLLRFELSPHEAPLTEQMPFLLSHTWFGDSMEGILCQSLPPLLLPLSNETKIPAANEHMQSLIHCELLVRNTSKAAIDVKQAAIYTELLNVYEKDGELETDEVILDSLSDGNLKMSIHHGQKKGWKKLSSNNSGMSEVFIRRGANFLKSMTSI